MKKPIDWKFYVREFDRGRDYDRMKEWFDARGKEFLPAHVLPKLGIVACEKMDGDAICGGWLFMDNSSPIAQIEFLCADFNLPLSKVRTGILTVVDYLTLSAQDMGYVIFRAITYPAIAHCAEQAGWKVLNDNLVTIRKMKGAK